MKFKLPKQFQNFGQQHLHQTDEQMIKALGLSNEEVKQLKFISDKMALVGIESAIDDLSMFMVQQDIKDALKS